MSNRFGGGILNLTQTVWWLRRKRKIYSVEQRREEGKKERKKERKEERKKEEKGKRRLPTLKEVGFLSYLGYLCLGVIQWPWSLALTLGLVKNSMEQTV